MRTSARERIRLIRRADDLVIIAEFGFEMLEPCVIAW